MRALRFLNIAALAFLLIGSAGLYAQDEKPKQDEPRPEERQNQPRPEGKQDEMKPPKQDESKPPKQDKKEEKQEQKQSRADEMRGGEANARPAGKGGHIPDDKFRAQFGRSHKFSVQRTTVVNGQPGFVYGGYTFGFVDPWPSDWAYSDDCYVDYVDGEYFLFDLLHPGMRIALFVVVM